MTTVPGPSPHPVQRELAPCYIPVGKDDQQAMLKDIGLQGLADLFNHLGSLGRFATAPFLGPALEYNQLLPHMEAIADKNHLRPSFIGDGLKCYRIPEICQQVSQIRGLTTAYTPYQPERSQGTLSSLWIYASALAKLTGFEVINSSLYDRASGLYEALVTARKTQGRGHRALICGHLYPTDREVLKSYVAKTSLELEFFGADPATGLCSPPRLAQVLDQTEDFFAVLYPQVNALGLLENVDALTDLAQARKLQTIAIIDPLLLATGGLKAPSEFGHRGQGSDFIVGEGQHLCLAPSFGGPGLGIFGTRYPGRNKSALRHSPGRLVGEGKDLAGRPCKVIVLATREQHIRRESATSNICSNQSFMATLAGASLLARGDRGLNEVLALSRQRACQASRELTYYQGVSLTYPRTAFWNEFVLDLGRDCDQVIELARQSNLHIGINVSPRVADGKNHHLMIFCNDWQQEADYQELYQFFATHFKRSPTPPAPLPDIPQALLRRSEVAIPQYGTQELIAYYQRLGEQNVSPDDALYPLGSCTMKYNPAINDRAAALNKFVHLHPQVPVADCQGSLQVLFEIQQSFKAITGLAAVATQPVAGAQGELVGLKMFQAYHQDHHQQRDVILIPRSAHGTNPATATMAGFASPNREGQAPGIVLIDACPDGLIDLGQVRRLIEHHGSRLCGIMITNPNTSGLLERHFSQIAELVHGAGGLVYMDGANMNAVASWLNLGHLGVDAVHNNLHKTWSIPHGGGGPGDAIVAVSERLADYLPGLQVVQKNDHYELLRPAKSIGQFHRHFGNFAHKVRALSYLKRLGGQGVLHMSAIAVLSSRYLYQHLKDTYATLPAQGEQPRMHEFILTLRRDEFAAIEAIGIPRAQIIMRIGKLFLDYGLHAPTVAFPEQFGLMIEPTESFTKQELDRFIQVAKSIKKLILENPEVLHTAPHFTPIDRVDEVAAHRNLVLSGDLQQLPEVLPNRLHPKHLATMPVVSIAQKILQAHRQAAPSYSKLHQ